MKSPNQMTGLEIMQAFQQGLLVLTLTWSTMAYVETYVCIRSMA